MKKKRRFKLITLIILCALCIASCAFLSAQHIGMKRIIYQNTRGDNISASYHSVQGAKAVMLVGDLGWDSGEMSVFSTSFIKMGYSVFVFEFPGTGFSAGTIPFHYNDGTFLAEQFYNALFVFSSTCSVPIRDIHIVAFGEGARAVLQTAREGYIEPASLTLIATGIKLGDGRDFDVLNYTNDSRMEWIRGLKDSSITCPVMLISSALDEASTTEDSELLAEQLDMITIKTEVTNQVTVMPDPVKDAQGNVVQPPPETVTVTTISEQKRDPVTVKTVKWALHPYMARSPEVLDEATSFIASLDRKDVPSFTAVKLIPLIRILVLPLAAAVMALYTLILRDREKYDTARVRQVAQMPEGLMKRKTAISVFAIPFAAAMAVLVYFISSRVAYNAMISSAMFASNGLLCFLLYLFTDLGRGMEGGLGEKEETHLLKPTVCFASACAFLGLLSLLGMGNYLSVNENWLARAALTAVFAMVFYADGMERRKAAFTSKEKRKILAVNYYSFLLYPLLTAAIGDFSTAAGCFGYIMALVMTLLLGELLEHFKAPAALRAVYMGFFFQMSAFARLVIFIK